MSPQEHQQPIDADSPPPGEVYPSKLTRRKLLFAAGGILVLGVGSAVKVADEGDSLPLAMQRSAPPSESASASPRASTAAPSLPPPQVRIARAPQYYVDDAGPMAIALTLDDGPDPVYTPQILDVLDQYRVRATFDMIGQQVRANLSLVREVAAAGHTIANHTWDHADLSRYSTARVLSEIDRCNDVLADAGQRPTVFRAPYGNWSSSVFEACAERGMNPLGWSVDPEDWDTAHVGTSDIVKKVLRHTRRHGIILAHDGGGDRSHTVAALRIFIPELLARGYVFTAV